MNYFRRKETRAALSSHYLVLDLDETLVHTFDNFESFYKIKESLSPQLKRRLYSFRLDGEFYWGIKRPYLDEFLKFSNNYFTKVGVWSAGVKENVEK